MKLRSIETTPSPNCMKLNLDTQASDRPLTLKLGEPTDAPAVFQNLLAIEGIQSVFAMSDFVTLTRKGGAEWPPILTTAGSVLGLADGSESAVNEHLADSVKQKENTEGNSKNKTVQNFGQVEVAIQKFRGIPVQVRVINDSQQARVALPERFNQALQRAIAATNANYVAERIWAPYQPQFGDVDAIAAQIATELDTLIDATELAAIEQRAISADTTPLATQQSKKELLTALQQTDWKQRLKAIQKIEVDEETFEAIATALTDERATIRRWAAALLGGSERADAVEPLSQVLLKDASPIVRRTAGDALSDLGNTEATEAMITALGDVSGLVRWRAARYLNELGDTSAIEPLTKATDTESGRCIIEI